MDDVDQLRGVLSGDAPLAQVFRERTGMGEAEARSALAKFGLLATEAQRPVGTLSPGERTRALLALLAGSAVTCLVLDEPTNHLDYLTTEALLNALKEYTGAVVVVSHDQFFVSEVAEEVYAVRKGKLVRLEGGMEEYVKLCRRAKPR